MEILMRELPETELFLRIPWHGACNPPVDVDSIETRDFAFHSEVLTIFVVVKSPVPTTHELFNTWKEAFSKLTVNVTVTKAASAPDAVHRDDGSNLVSPSAVINNMRQKATGNGEGDAKPTVVCQENGNIVYTVRTPLTKLGTDFGSSALLSVVAASGVEPGCEVHQNFGEDAFIEEAVVQYAALGGVRINRGTAGVVPTFSKQMEATLRLIPPPRVSQWQTTLGNVRYVSVSLTNTHEIPIDITDATLCMTPNLTADGNRPNISLSMSRSLGSAISVAGSQSQMTVSGLGVNQQQQQRNKSMQDLWDVSNDPTQYPMSLAPGESHTFVFSVEPLGIPQREGAPPKKGATNTFSFHSVMSLTWSTGPLVGEGQYLTCQYNLTPVATEAAELSISVTVPNVVHSHSKFPVSFTIINSSAKARDVSLILHQPRRAAATTKDKTPVTDFEGQVLPAPVAADARALMQHDESQASLVCMDETVYLGRIDANTSKLAIVDFYAFKSGAYELALAHLYDHPTKAFLDVKCPATHVYVLPQR